MRDAKRPVKLTLQKITITEVQVSIPAFCPYCGTDLRGEEPNELHEEDATYPLQLWITTMGAQKARVTRSPTCTSDPPTIERDPGEFDPGDETCFTTGACCSGCGQTLATSAGACSPKGNV
jgi:hypothetical protein